MLRAYPEGNSMNRLYNSWHRQFAAEVLKSLENQNDPLSSAFVNKSFSERVSSVAQVIPLILEIAAENSDEKLASIAKTAAEIEEAREKQGNRFYRKVTDAQRAVLGKALLVKFGTARGIAAAAWSLTNEEIEAA